MTRGKFRPKCANLLTGILTAATADADADADAAAAPVSAVTHWQTFISAPTSLDALPEEPSCLQGAVTLNRLGPVLPSTHYVKGLMILMLARPGQ